MVSEKHRNGIPVQPPRIFWVTRKLQDTANHHESSNDDESLEQCGDRDTSVHRGDCPRLGNFDIKSVIRISSALPYPSLTTDHRSFVSTHRPIHRRAGRETAAQSAPLGIRGDIDGVWVGGLIFGEDGGGKDGQENERLSVGIVGGVDDSRWDVCHFPGL